MKTYTQHKMGDLTVYVSDDTNRVHHAVNYTSENPVTLYPYEASKTGGYDNISDVLTLEQARRRYNRGTLIFR